MDYDDNDFQNQNLHLAGEANNKFPPVLQPYALPKFDFDDTLNGNLRFDSLVETEVFLGIEGNEDSNWIEDFSRGSSGIVFSSGATESCAISRHNNVWSEATSSESVEMLLNSVGQDEVIVRENTIKKSDTCDELGYPTEQMEPGQTYHEKSLTKEEIVNLQPSPSVDDTPGESSVLKTDAGQEQVLVEDGSRTLLNESSVEEMNAILASKSVNEEAVITADHANIGTEETDSLLDQKEDEACEKSRMENECSDTNVHSVVTCSAELNNQEILLPKTFSDKTDVSMHSQSRNYNPIDLAIDGQPVLIEDHSVSHIDSTSKVENAKAEKSGDTAQPDLKEMEASDFIVLERGDQALSSLEVVSGQDVSGAQYQDHLVSSAHDSSPAGASREFAAELTPVTSLGVEKPDLKTETHTQRHLIENSESVFNSPVDSIIESTISGMSKKSDNNEGCGRPSNLIQSLELAVNSYNSDQDVESSRVLSESVVSESVGYVSGGSASKLADSKIQSDTVSKGKPVTLTDRQQCEAIPLNPEVLLHFSKEGAHVGAPAVSVTSLSDLHMLKTISDADDQGLFSEIKKLSSGEAENDKIDPPVDASSSGFQMDQQSKSRTEDIQASTQYGDGCPASEELKDAVDDDAAGIVIVQQSQETIVEETLVTDIKKAPETQPTVDKDGRNEKPNTSSLSNLGIEVSKDDQREDHTDASGDIMKAESSVSQPKGDAIEIGDSHASSSSEPSVKSHETEAENMATNRENSPIAFHADKTSKVPLCKTEADSVRTSEGQNIVSLLPDGSQDFNRIETSSTGMNLTSDLPKAGDISKVVNLPQATLVSPIVVGSPSTSSLEKMAAKASKTKTERKPRRTSKSAGKGTSRKGNSVKGVTPSYQFQSGGKPGVVNHSSASSILITQSTEKQQQLQASAQKSIGPFSTPMTSLPDLNSSALSNILRRPFTDLQQVQLRAQIFVYGALIQGTAPDEAYMISAFGGPDGGKGSWENAWRACVLRAQKSHFDTPETPIQPRAGKTESPSMGHTSSKESSITNPIIPLSSPLWSLSAPLDTLQASGIQRGSATAHQPLLSSSHIHQTPPIKNIVGHNAPWMSPPPYRSPWLASPQASAYDVGARFPVFPITEPVKLTPVKESSLPYSGAKNVQKDLIIQSGTSSNVFKGTATLEPTTMALAPAQNSTGTKPRKRKKTPISVEPSPSILNSLKQTELVGSPLVTISTPVPIITTVGNPFSTTTTLPKVVSTMTAAMSLASTFPGKKTKSSLSSPIFGGNLVPGSLEVKERHVLSEDTIHKLKEAKIHAEDASALATAAVSHSQYVWKQIDQQRYAGLDLETQGRLGYAAVAIAAAAAVAKAAAAAANVAANAALQAKLMAEEASIPRDSDQDNELLKSNDSKIPGHSAPASILKGESPVAGSSSVLIAAREAAKKRIEAATAATKRAENMDSIVKAAELASEAVSQAGILVSMGHPPSLDELVEVGPSSYWRHAPQSQQKRDSVEKEPQDTSGGNNIASLRDKQTELDDTMKPADGVSGSVSATGKNTRGQNCAKDADVAKNNAVVFELESGSKLSIDSQTQSEQIVKTTNDGDLKEGSNVEVFKEGPGFRSAWYAANVLSLEDDKAYVLFNDLSAEQGTDKLKEWVTLKGEGNQAPKIRTARSITAMPYEGTRKRRRAAIGDPVWKIGDKVDSWVHDSWLEGVVTEKNKKDENTLTVHFPAQGALTIKAWNLRPSLVWKDGRWIECTSSGSHISSSHEGVTPNEKRPRLGTQAIVAEGKDTSTKSVDDLDLGKPPQTALLDLGVSENTFNIGRSTKDENKPDQLRMKRTGLQKQGSRVIFGVPKPGKKRKFMEVSKHYDSEASSRTRERKEPAKSVKSSVSQSSGPGSWRMPSKNISREKQITLSKPKIFKPTLKTKEKPGSAARIIPRKDSRTTVSNLGSDDAADQTTENKGSASGASTDVLTREKMEEQTASSAKNNVDIPSSKNSSSSSINKGKVTTPSGRLAKIEEDKILTDNSSKPSDGVEPRRSNRRIQPTSRLLEGLQTSMITSKIPSVSHSKSNQSQSKK